MSTLTVPTAQDAAPRSSRRWLALSVLAFAQFLVVLDASIVNIALPVLGQQLGMDTAALAWVITAYVLAFGQLCHLIVTTQLDGRPEQWAKLLTRGIRHPD